MRFVLPVMLVALSSSSFTPRTGSQRRFGTELGRWEKRPSGRQTLSASHAGWDGCAACVIFPFSLEFGSWEKSLAYGVGTVEINCGG